MEPETKPEPKTEETKAEPGETLLTDKKEPEKKTDEAKPGAPEKYEPFTAPKSWAEKGLELDQTIIDKAVPKFKELGLNQAQAQSLIDFYAGVSEETHDASIKAVADMRKGWVDQVKADKEIGGKLAEVKTTIGRALDGLGDPTLAADFRAAMDLTGAGDHPAFIKAFYRMASKLTEGGHVKGNGPSPFGQGNGTQPSVGAKSLYPNLP